MGESEGADKTLFGLLSAGICSYNIEAIGEALRVMKAQIPNIKVIRSAWRRVKNDIKDAIIRDLKPMKDVKGGGGAVPPPRGPTGSGG
jgi:hypothetical protein